VTGDECFANLGGEGEPLDIICGQPILRTTTKTLKGHFGDWNLPDFDQYHRLARILARSVHSLVILTDDVHYGRIARCVLPSGSELIEIISSPMSLVDERVEETGKKRQPSSRLPTPPKLALQGPAECVFRPRTLSRLLVEGERFASVPLDPIAALFLPSSLPPRG